MLLLSLFWLGLGLFVGLLVCAARKNTMALKQWLLMMGIGAVVALAGGWLGVWLLGRYFSTAMALWLAIGGSVVLAHVLFKAKARALTFP